MLFLKTLQPHKKLHQTFGQDFNSVQFKPTNSDIKTSKNCILHSRKFAPLPMKYSFLLKSLSCNISLHYSAVPVPTGGWPPLRSRLLQVHAELRFGLKMNGIPDRWTAKHGRHCSGQRDDSGEDLQDQVQSGWTALSAVPYLK